MDFPVFSEFKIPVPHPETDRRICGDEQDADVSVNLTAGLQQGDRSAIPHAWGW